MEVLLMGIVNINTKTDKEELLKLVIVAINKDKMHFFNGTNDRDESVGTEYKEKDIEKILQENGSNNVNIENCINVQGNSDSIEKEAANFFKVAEIMNEASKISDEYDFFSSNPDKAKSVLKEMEKKELIDKTPTVKKDCLEQYNTFIDSSVVDVKNEFDGFLLNTYQLYEIEKNKRTGPQKIPNGNK